MPMRGGRNRQRKCQIVLKIPHFCIDTDEKRKRCDEIYKDKCDVFVVQNILPLFKSVDYSKVKVADSGNVHQTKGLSATICPQPFYLLHVDASGDVFPCDCGVGTVSAPLPKLGNIGADSLYDIWNSASLRKCQRAQLENTAEYCR